MNYDIEKKLIRFLNAKIEKIYRETREDKPELDFNYIKTVKGFERSDIKHRPIEAGFTFFNSNGNRCLLYYTEKTRRIVISMEIDNLVSSSDWYGTIGMLYCCMDEIDEIAKELRHLKGELEKREKINEIVKNSINTWLKAILEHQPYSYYTTESANKITLSVKLKNRLQLDIPIHYSSFQKIMPALLETIQKFEKTVNDNKIKALIRNSAIGQQWITEKSDAVL